MRCNHSWDWIGWAHWDALYPADAYDSVFACSLCGYKIEARIHGEKPVEIIPHISNNSRVVGECYYLPFLTTTET